MACKIIFQVQGKATIKEIAFEGNKRFKEARLRRESQPEGGRHSGRAQGATRTRRRSQDLYQKAGYPDAKVDLRGQHWTRTRARPCCEFKISEGNRVFLKQIKFTGNKAYPTARLLKLIKTRRRWWGSWLAGTGVLKEEDVQGRPG